MVIASASRREALVRELERLQTADEEPFQARLTLVNEAETLATFMHDGLPDAELFETHVGSLAKDLCGRYGRVRAYGEMVGRLWAERAYSAAIELEMLWNDLVDSVGFDLYCGYPIDVLSEDFQTRRCVHCWPRTAGWFPRSRTPSTPRCGVRWMKCSATIPMGCGPQRTKSFIPWRPRSRALKGRFYGCAARFRGTPTKF